MKSYSHIYANEGCFVDFISKNKIDTNKKLLIVCFCSIADQKKTESDLVNIKKILSNSTIVGSSSCGEIFEDKLTEDSMVLSIYDFDSTTFVVDSYLCSGDNKNIGVAIGKKAAKLNAKLALLFSNSTNSNGDFIISGITMSNQKLCIAGGMSSCNDNSVNTYTILDNRLTTEMLIAVYMSGEELNVFTTKSFNWIPIGPSFKVEHSVENRVYSINGMTPYDLYKKYLGEEAVCDMSIVSLEFPLVFFRNGHLIGRTPLITHSDGSMSFTGNIQSGEIIQFAFGNLDAILADSIKLPQQLANFSPEAVLIFSCLARKKFMNNHINAESTNFSQLAPTTGFYTYGEFFHDMDSKNNLFLNETITVLSLREGSLKEKENKKIISNMQHHAKSNTIAALLNLAHQTSNELNKQNLLDRDMSNHETSINKLSIQNLGTSAVNNTLNMIAHQWKQPLATMGLIANSMKIRELQTSTPNKINLIDIDSLNRHIEHLSKTIDDFRTSFKPEDLPIKTTALEISAKIESAINPLLQADNISFENKIHCSQSMMIYQNKLVHVLTALITNSREAIKARNIANGKISLDWDCAHDNQWCKLTLIDNGGGVSQKVMDRLFEPYATTKQSTGEGLGLYMCKIVIEKHFYGTININNSANGTITVIEFPNNKLKHNFEDK